MKFESVKLRQSQKGRGIHEISTLKVEANQRSLNQRRWASSPTIIYPVWKVLFSWVKVRNAQIQQCKTAAI